MSIQRAVVVEVKPHIPFLVKIMSISRPFAYNTGSTISGTYQIGDLAIGIPTTGFTGSMEWWNGADEELGYVICGSVPSDTQPAPDGRTASVQFWRSSALTDSSFINLTNYLTGQSFIRADEAAYYLRTNGYWNSWSQFTNPTDFILIATGSTIPSAGEIVFNNSNACYDPKTTIMRISYTDRFGNDVSTRVKSYTGATGSTELVTYQKNINESNNGPSFLYQTTSFTDYGTYLELVHTLGNGTCGGGLWIVGELIQLGLT